MRAPRLLAAGLLLAIGSVERVHAATCELPPGEAATVAAVQDGETLKLTDGRVVRLVGIKAPMPPLGWRGDDPWPLVAEAEAALSRYVAGADIELRFGGRRADRHDQLLAHVFTVKDGKRLWLQEELVGAGLARVYSLADNRACLDALLAVEAKARDARRGVWRSSAYRIRQAADLDGLDPLMHTYQLVEGKIVAVGEGREWIYLNFGDDWRSDFTIGVPRKTVPDFAEAGIDLKTLQDRSVRVRGWLQWRNGPMIEATHPEQIELLSGPAAASAPGQKNGRDRPGHDAFGG